MRKYVVIIGLFFVFCLLEGCSKKDNTMSYPTFSSPDWIIDASGKYPVSMTAVVSLPDNLRSSLQSGDKLGAFVNDECRGLGVIVNVNNTSVFYVLVHGTAAEQSRIMFKYYNVKTSYMYMTSDFLTFTVDENYGTADSPQVLDLQQIKY